MHCLLPRRCSRPLGLCGQPGARQFLDEGRAVDSLGQQLVHKIAANGTVADQLAEGADRTSMRCRAMVFPVSTLHSAAARAATHAAATSRETECRSLASRAWSAGSKDWRCRVYQSSPCGSTALIQHWRTKSPLELPTAAAASSLYHFLSLSITDQDAHSRCLLSHTRQDVSLPALKTHVGQRYRWCVHTI